MLDLLGQGLALTFGRSEALALDREHGQLLFLSAHLVFRDGQFLALGLSLGFEQLH